MVNVEFVIGSEKVAETEEFSATPLPPLAGEVDDTVGGVVSRATPVVNCQVKSAANALPVSSVTAALMVALYCVFAVRPDVGVNDPVLPVSFTVPMTAAPPAVGLSVKLAVLTVNFFIGLEKVADTEEFSATPLAPFAGDVEDTVGSVVSIFFALTATSPGVSPPQPNRLRLANNAAVNAPVETLDLTFLFGMWEALK